MRCFLESASSCAHSPGKAGAVSIITRLGKDGKAPQQVNARAFASLSSPPQPENQMEIKTGGAVLLRTSPTPPDSNSLVAPTVS